MSDALIASEAGTWFDAERGLLDRRVFDDAEIYRRELTHIFARAWHFVCHESQIRSRGDYFLTCIGEDQVIAVRDRDGNVQVLLNSCPHRGNTLCRADQGNTQSFLCSYHGWNFDLNGDLIGMPGERQFYRGGMDKSQWGLAKAAQVSSYRGFVFATLDPAAPTLDEYLGWVGRLGIDMMASKGELEIVDGIQKNRIRCNWKIAVDNLYDWYHVRVSHGSAMKVGLLPDASISAESQMVILGEYGHGIGGPGISEAELLDLEARVSGAEGESQWFDFQATQRLPADVRNRLGPVGTRSLGHPNIFPNLWIALTNQVCLRIPRGPHETELWWFTLLPKGMPEKNRKRAIFYANHMFGPGGLLEQDDGENWSHSTRGARGAATRSRPVNLTMGLGLDRVAEDPSGQSGITTVVNEHGQRWTYRCWQDWMRADSWEALRRSHSIPPRGVV